MRAEAKLADLPVPAVLAELDATPQGLSGEQARGRLERFGPNEIAEKRKSPLLVLLGYFWAPIPWMIEVALVLSLVVRHWTDAAVIGVLLVMNVSVAFAEEHQAANAIAALKRRLAVTARVLRDGAWATLPIRELVPGDVIRVRLGDVAPADARLLGDASLQVDQSSLTGESLPVTRGAGDVLYSGAVVVRGEADALVYATGVCDRCRQFLRPHHGAGGDGWRGQPFPAGGAADRPLPHRPGGGPGGYHLGGVDGAGGTRC